MDGTTLHFSVLRTSLAADSRITEKCRAPSHSCLLDWRTPPLNSSAAHKLSPTSVALGSSPVGRALRGTQLFASPVSLHDVRHGASSRCRTLALDIRFPATSLSAQGLRNGAHWTMFCRCRADSRTWVNGDSEQSRHNGALSFDCQVYLSGGRCRRRGERKEC